MPLFLIPNAANLTGDTLASNVVNASLNSITPTGGKLSISGAIQLPSLNTWALTSFGDGNFYISRPGVANYVVVSPTGLAVTGSISATTRVNYPSFTVATLPAVGSAGGNIYVSDESGGAQPAFSDGTNWRRYTDRAVVS